MGSVSRRFLIALFSLFGSIIIFINFVIWSDTGITVINSGTDYYFGFRSLLLMFENMNDLFIFKSTDLRSITSTSLNLMSLGLPEWIQTLRDYQAGLIDKSTLILLYFQELGIVLLSPIMVSLGLLGLAAVLLSFLVAVVVAIFGALWGQYSIQVPPNPYETSELFKILLHSVPCY